jgi:hypothetical protein
LFGAFRKQHHSSSRTLDIFLISLWVIFSRVAYLIKAIVYNPPGVGVRHLSIAQSSFLDPSTIRDVNGNLKGDPALDD